MEFFEIATYIIGAIAGFLLISVLRTIQAKVQGLYKEVVHLQATSHCEKCHDYKRLFSDSERMHLRTKEDVTFYKTEFERAWAQIYDLRKEIVELKAEIARQ